MSDAPGRPGAFGASAPVRGSDHEQSATEQFVDSWHTLSPEERVAAFRALPRGEAGDMFLSLHPADCAAVLRELPPQEQRLWLRLLPPDEVADVVQQFDDDEQPEIVSLLDARSRAQVEALLRYRTDVAGGKMNPNYAHVPPEMTVEQALGYLRLQASGQIPMIYYAYVLDREERLAGMISFRELILASPERRVSEVMQSAVASVREDLDQEAIAAVMQEHNLLAVPVVDAEGHMKGIVTVDDVIDVVREEATEDIQKIGGVEALDVPYLRTGPLSMLRKRGGWLSVLFVGQMLTATAMAFFEDEIAQLVTLVIFVPLIISSGGNAGSQASTLVIRAMALGEVRLNDWWRVVRRELVLGLALGALLAVLGALRVSVWEVLFSSYAGIFVRLIATVAISVVSVVTWGTLMGATLPFLLRRVRFDPASASAPLVATTVDVTGLVIYFTVAKVILLGGS